MPSAERKRHGGGYKAAWGSHPIFYQANLVPPPQCGDWVPSHGRVLGCSPDPAVTALFVPAVPLLAQVDTYTCETVAVHAYE